jgi:hypothetical protein
VKTYSTVFPEIHLVKCGYSGNSILVALPEKPELTVRGWMEKAEAFEKKYPTGLNLPALLEAGAAQTVDISPGARILLDKDGKD